MRMLVQINSMSDQQVHQHRLLPLPYFFGYKTEFFPFQNNSKNLDPSYNKAKTSIVAKFHWTDLVSCSHFRERKTPS